MKATTTLVSALFAIALHQASGQITNWPVQAGGNGHYYEAVLAPGGITWSNASVTASNRGGYLATITSSNENAFVFTYVNADRDLWYQNWYGPWLGGLQPPGSLEPAGGWQWVTGEAFRYANWAAGQPNNTGGNEDRIHFGGQSPPAGTWNDASANSTSVRSFVIEYEAQPTDLPEAFFGEYVSPYPYDLARTVPRPTNLTAVALATARFSARLIAPGMETFEQYATNSSPAALHFGAMTANITGTYYIGGITDPTATVNGVFPYAGTNYLNLTANATITVTFSSPQAAFGFVGTDSETNRLLVTLVTADRGDIQLTVPVTRPQGSGGAFFFGVLAVGTPFTAVRLTNTGSQDDGVAVDNMVVADASQVIAVPRLTIHRMPPEICWDTVSNAGYQLQFSTNLTGGTWTPMHGDYYRGSGGTVCTNYSMPAGELQRFYRIAVTNSIP